MTARRVLTTASLGTVAVLVAFTAPLASFNQTVAGLGAGHSGATWVLSSMSIGLGAFLLTAGRLADDYGRRRWFVVGPLSFQPVEGALIESFSEGLHDAVVIYWNTAEGEDTARSYRWTFNVI